MIRNLIVPDTRKNITVGVSIHVDAFFGPLAQLVRAIDSYSRGRRFKPYKVHYISVIKMILETNRLWRQLS